MTNGDKIRSMTDEELESFFLCELDYDVCPPGKHCNPQIIPCCNCWKNWLKQECTENGQS